MGKHKRKSGIYLILNLSNRKSYIGHSKDILKRWDTHKHHLRRNSHKNDHLQKAWNNYGEQLFSFSILELLSGDFTKQQFEEVETKWVLQYKSHMTEFGYNSVLPGSIPLEKTEEMNKCKIGDYFRANKSEGLKPTCICINKLSGEVIEKIGYKEISELTGIPIKKVTDYCNFWVKFKGRRKCYKGWIVVKKELYDPEFNYLTYRGKIIPGVKKTWRDYEKTRTRNLKKIIT